MSKKVHARLMLQVCSLSLMIAMIDLSELQCATTDLMNELDPEITQGCRKEGEERGERLVFFEVRQSFGGIPTADFKRSSQN
eukprot:13500-Heterococcus_DN1.PRE.3